MAVSPVNEIENQFARLPAETQLSLLERLVHHLRQSLEAPRESWEAELLAMAADPQMQMELSRIDSEFSAAEADGFRKSTAFA
jgi:hypothetical protein